MTSPVVPGAKLLISPAVVGLCIGAAAVFVGLGVFILPVWAGVRIRRHMRRKEEMRRRAAMSRNNMKTFALGPLDFDDGLFNDTVLINVFRLCYMSAAMKTYYRPVGDADSMCGVLCCM